MSLKQEINIQEIYNSLPKTYQRALMDLAKTMKEQSDKGLQKYGFTMDDNTSKDPEYWKNHLKQEVADAMVYMQKLIEVMEKSNSSEK